MWEALCSTGFSLWILIDAESTLLQQPHRLKPVLLILAALYKFSVGSGEACMATMSSPANAAAPVRRAASCAVTLQTVRLQSTALPISAPSVEAVTAAG